MPAYHIKITKKIEDTPPHQWNAVVGGDTLQKGHRWQKYKQTSQADGWPKSWTAFVTVWSTDRLVGVATAYQYPMPMPFATPWLRRLSQIVMAPTNPINFLVPPTVASWADEKIVFPLLIQGIKKLMRQHMGLGLRLVFLDKVEQRPLLNHLQQAHFLIREGIWQNNLTIHWDTFAGYENSLKRDPRNQLRKQKKKAARAGIVITTELPEDTRPIYELFDRVATKNRSNLLYNRQFLHHAQHILGEKHFTLFRAVHQGKTIACLMMYHDQTSSQLAAVGLDYALSQTYNLYRVLIYAAIERSIALGLHHIHGGMSRYHIKRRIGFVSSPTQTATYAWLPFIKTGYNYTPASLRDEKIA